MQTVESFEVLKEKIDSGEFGRSRELLKRTCECGKTFFVNADDIGIEKLCIECKKSKTLLLENKQQNMQ